MNLEAVLLKEHTKENCRYIVSWVGASRERFGKLFHLFLTGEYRVAQRAAWPVSYCVMAHPALIQGHFEELLSNVHRPGIHDSIKRNTMRLLQWVHIPPEYEGAVLDLCFQYLSSPREAVAIKAFSLTVLEKFAALYPDIIPEVKLLIEDQLPRQTAAFRSRAKKFLSKFN